MAVMTFVTSRDVAMFLMMTALTSRLGMSTREVLQFLGRAVMTVGACFGQFLHSRNSQWRMRVLMATETFNLLRAVGLTMTGRAKRHQVIVIVLARIICMKYFVTLLACKTMLAACVLQVSKLTGVALATLGRLQRNRVGRIKGGVNRRQRLGRSKNEPWLE